MERSFVPLVGEQMMNRGMEYLRGELAKHPTMRPELRAAVVYALAEAGDTKLAAALECAVVAAQGPGGPEALAMTGLAMLQVHECARTQVAAWW